MVTLKNFDYIQEEVNIERIIAYFDAYKNVILTRSQFPLTRSWTYLCINLDKVSIDLGDDSF